MKPSSSNHLPQCSKVVVRSTLPCKVAVRSTPPCWAAVSSDLQHHSLCSKPLKRYRLPVSSRELASLCSYSAGWVF
ncbi:MAG: hypothetical protein U0L04_05700 [Bacteroidaceae bacterium]|nr:hypothetical protein [Bacteroidaceae bacterium]